MKIVKHPSCTHDLGAPADMQDGSCSALPVRYDETEHGTFAVSFWQPEPEDLALLNNGGTITLHVRAPGRQHPVVALGAQLDEPTPAFLDMFELLKDARRERANRDAELTILRAENAHLKRALALSDALRNKERNLPL